MMMVVVIPVCGTMDVWATVGCKVVGSFARKGSSAARDSQGARTLIHRVRRRAGKVVLEWK